jgi:5'-nucleotidase
MKRCVLLAIAAGLLLAVLAPTASAKGKPPKPPKDNDTYVQLLAINDFHGNLAATSANTIQTGCCTAVTNTATPPVTSWVQNTVPAGGVEYLATHIKSLRLSNSNTITVGAGDLIGASPLVSALFHDEPTIEAMNILGLDVTGVGNHEFDEGVDELLRMQNGGCHPVDGCLDGDPFPGAVFQYLAANVFYEGTDETIFPPYEIRKIGNAKIAFLGLTLEGTPTIVTPSGVAGLEFRPEVETINELVQKLRNEQGVRSFVVLLHQGGAQRPPSQPAYPAAVNPDAYTDVNRCVNFNGPELTSIVSALDPQIDVVISAHTHQPYICEIAGKVVTSAASFGRVITDIDLVIDHQTKDITSVKAVNRIVTRDVDADPAETALLKKYTDLSAPLANKVIGGITADIRSSRDTPSGQNDAGEQPMGDVIADAMLEAASPGDFGGAVAAFMNAGGVRGGLLYSQISGGEQPGEVTYAEAFTVQPFGNTLVVKTCSGQAIYNVLEQQFNNPSVGSNRIMLVSGNVHYQWDSRTTPRIVPGSVTFGGVPIGLGTNYRVVMNNFMADGGDGYTVFRDQCTAPLGGSVDLDAFAAYLTKHRPVAPPELTRITKVG